MENQQEQKQLKRKSPRSEEELPEEQLSGSPTKQEHQEARVTKQQKVNQATSPSKHKTLQEQVPPSKPNKTTRPIVELDSSIPALVTRQKPIELAEVSNQVKKTLVAVTEELEACTSHLELLSPSQTNLIACLVHESDKTLSGLTNYVHSKLLPQTILLDDEPSKEPFDPLPLRVIETTIKQVARRINYAPVQDDLDWLPPDLPKGFQIWRWEAKDLESVIPPDLREISQKRWSERQLIKPQVCTMLSGLDTSEKEVLLRKLNPGKRKPAKINTNSSTPKPIQPSKSRQASSSQEIICLGSSPTTPKPQEAGHQDTGEKVLSEKETIKQQKEQKRKEREDARLAEERQKKKMGSLMSGWMTKANSTSRITASKRNYQTEPNEIQVISSPQNSTQLDLSNQKLSSDFDKTFKPFHLKPYSQLAPINRFRPIHQSQLDSAQPETCGPLTHQECLDQLLKMMQSEAKKCGSFMSNKKKITTVREVVNGIAESELSGYIDGSKKWRRALQNRSIIPVKFLRFHEDVRPGYIGTWCKTSRLVSGRNPFGKDTCLLDYDYDSEADWNEEDAEGEDLEQSDGGKEDGGDGMSSEVSDSDEDGWLVGDDDEIEMIDDASNRTLDPKLDDDRQLVKSNKKVIGLARRKIVGPLIPVIKGPMWEETLGLVCNNMLEPFRIQMINDAPLGLNPFTYEPKAVVKINRPKLSTVGFKPSQAILPLPDAANQTKNTSTEFITNKTSTQTKSQEENIKENEGMTSHQNKILDSKLNDNITGLNSINFPKELIPEMIQVVNGNKKSKPVLLEDLKNLFFEKFHTKVSKKSIEKALHCFTVKVAGTWRIIDSNKNNLSSTTH